MFSIVVVIVIMRKRRKNSKYLQKTNEPGTERLNNSSKVTQLVSTLPPTATCHHSAYVAPIMNFSCHLS